MYIIIDVHTHTHTHTHTQGYQQDGHDDVEQHNRVDQHVAHKEEGYATICFANVGLLLLLSSPTATPFPAGTTGLTAGEQAASKIGPPVSGQHLEEDTCI